MCFVLKSSHSGITLKKKKKNGHSPKPLYLPDCRPLEKAVPTLFHCTVKRLLKIGSTCLSAINEFACSPSLFP